MFKINKTKFDTLVSQYEKSLSEAEYGGFDHSIKAESVNLLKTVASFITQSESAHKEVADVVESIEPAEIEVLPEVQEEVAPPKSKGRKMSDKSN